MPGLHRSGALPGVTAQSSARGWSIAARASRTRVTKRSRTPLHTIEAAHERVLCICVDCAGRSVPRGRGCRRGPVPFPSKQAASTSPFSFHSTCFHVVTECSGFWFGFRPDMLAIHAALLAFTPTRPLYPTSKALQTGTLAVTEPHSLYFELHGKAGGAPALFLHGGPGAGCSARHAGFFDPKHYQVVLLDQRGCGRSTPKGEVQGNNAAELVQDCERLREHLGIDQWACVLGGSWGTTLALAYAGAHPDRVGSIVLRAVCLMRAAEIRWLFGLGGGMSRLLPGSWAPLQQHWEKQRAERTGAAEAALSEAPEDALLCWYADALGGRLSEKAMSEASGAWSRYEMGVFGLSSRLPAHGLETLPGAERSTWVWEPNAQQWTAGATLLPEKEVSPRRHLIASDCF